MRKSEVSKGTFLKRISDFGCFNDYRNTSLNNLYSFSRSVFRNDALQKKCNSYEKHVENLKIMYLYVFRKWGTVGVENTKARCSVWLPRETLAIRQQIEPSSCCSWMSVEYWTMEQQLQNRSLELDPQNHPPRRHYNRSVLTSCRNADILLLQNPPSPHAKLPVLPNDGK